MFLLAFVARSLQGHWWGFISRNYVVWPIFFLMNVFIALKGTHFLILFAFNAAGVVPCGGRKTFPHTSTIVQFIFFFWSFEISVNILRNQKEMIGLDSYSRQVFNYLVGWLCWGLTSQSTIFQSCRDGAIASWVINQYFRGVKCLAQGHNTATVGLEPRTSRSGVRHSTTELPRSPLIIWTQFRFISVFELTAYLKFAKLQYISTGFRCRFITGSLMRFY